MAIKDYRSEPLQLSFNCIGVLPLLSKKQKNTLLNSNEGWFRTNFLPLIPADLVSKLYSDKDNVRPSSYAIPHIAAIFLAQLTGLTETEFLEQIPWNFKYQFAVGIDQWTDKVEFGPDTFKDIRARIKKYNAEHPGEDIWDKITRFIDMQMVLKMGLLTNRYNDTYQFGLRMDSLMIDMQATHRPRLDLVYCTIDIAIKYLKKKIIEIPIKLQHFLEKGDRRNTVYIHGTAKEYRDAGLEDAAKPADSLDDKERRDAITDLKLKKLLPEAVILQEYMEELGLDTTDEYIILSRMVSEQTRKDKDDSLIILDKKEISATSLQSPYEVEATYRYKRKPEYGYVGSTTELFNTQGEGIIVDRRVEPNNYTDQQFMKDFHEGHDPMLSVNEGDRAFMSVDAGFVSVELNASSNSLGYDVYCAGVHGVEPDTIFADFIMNPQKTEIIRCPAGHKPDKSALYGNVFRIRFADKRCSSCINKERCNPTITGKTENRGSSYVDVSESKIIAAICVKMRRGELGDEAIEYINKRNAIEGINAVIRMRYRIDDRTTPGLFFLRYSYYTIITCYNWTKYLYYCRNHNVNRDLEKYLVDSFWH